MQYCVQPSFTLLICIIIWKKQKSDSWSTLRNNLWGRFWKPIKVPQLYNYISRSVRSQRYLRFWKWGNYTSGTFSTRMTTACCTNLLCSYLKIDQKGLHSFNRFEQIKNQWVIWRNKINEPIPVLKTIETKDTRKCIAISGWKSKGSENRYSDVEMAEYLLPINSELTI